MPLAPVLGCTTHTVANWKNGRTSVDRKFALRIAELLDEPAEYVLACLEADREQDAEVRKVWRRIAERFRSTASILLVALGLMTAHQKAAATVLAVELVGNSQTNCLYIMRNWARRRRRLAKLLGCLKSQLAAPLPPPMGTDPLYGIAAERIATLTGAHISTARRWKRSGKHPRWLEPFLAMAVSGQLGPIERAWRGWVLRDQYLVSPEGWRFSFGEIRSIPFLHAQVRTYQTRERTHLQADWIDERYVAPVSAAGADRG